MKKNLEVIPQRKSYYPNIRHSYLPPLIPGLNLSECRKLYSDLYLAGLETPDGVHVRFSQSRFYQAFFQPPDRIVFDRRRAERILWLGAILRDPHCARVYDIPMVMRALDLRRRIAVWPDLGYVAVIRIDDKTPIRAEFICAYYLPPNQRRSTMKRLLASPPWNQLHSDSESSRKALFMDVLRRP